MKIRHIGHAGFIVEAAGKRILIDPWFNPAFFGTWRPNPSNAHLRSEVIGQRYDWLYVSHGHGDHYDTATLAEIEVERVLIAPWLDESGLFADDETFEWYEDADLSVSIIPDNWRQDSMLLLVADGQRALFANDCNLTTRTADGAREIPVDWPTDVDILACQFSGASYYPAAYRYSPEFMAEKVGAARDAQLEMLVEKVERCQAKALIPCAGPAYVTGQKTGPGSAFPVWAELAEAFAKRCPRVEVRTEGLLMAQADVIERHETAYGYVEFRIPALIKAEIDAGRLTFEDALSTQCVEIRRVPDVFDPAVMYPLRGRAWRKP